MQLYLFRIVYLYVSYLQDLGRPGLQKIKQFNVASTSLTNSYFWIFYFNNCIAISYSCERKFFFYPKK